MVAPGNYDLGDGDECEVILSGPKMESRHANLSFDGEHLIITPLDGKVCDAHGNEITESLALRLGMPIEMGGIWIAVDDVNAEWPDPTDVVPIMPAPPTMASTNQQETPTIVSNSIDEIPRQRAKKALITSVSLLFVLGIAGLTVAPWLFNHPSESSKPPVPASATAL